MLKKKTKTKLKKIKKAVCKSIKKGIENMGTSVAKSKGII